MLIPCRRCTDENGGQEVRKPLLLFAPHVSVADFWENSLAHGQDLCCMRCRNITFREVQDRVLVCDGCQKLLPGKSFDAENMDIWRQGLAEPVHCRRCSERKDRARREDLELIFCSGCQRRVPEINFEEAKLAEWRYKDLLYLAECARCVVKKMDTSGYKKVPDAAKHSM